MISYCPLDPEPDVQPHSRRRYPPFAPQNRPTVAAAVAAVVDEDTECNYLVLFFILGVMILAASDSISIRHR